MKPPSFLTGLVTTIILFISGLIFLVVFSFTFNENLVTPDYYSKDLNYQDHLDKLTRSSKLERGLDISYVMGKGIKFSIESGYHHNSATGEILLYRPSSNSMDRRFPLSLTNGQQFLDTEDLESGPWDVQVNWKMAGIEYYTSKEIIVE